MVQRPGSLLKTSQNLSPPTFHLLNLGHIFIFLLCMYMTNSKYMCLCIFLYTIHIIYMVAKINKLELT